MLFKKTEPKKRSLTTVLTVSALAAIGAYSIGCCGKKLVKGAWCKIKGMFGNMGDCMSDCMTECVDGMSQKIDKMCK